MKRLFVMAATAAVLAFNAQAQSVEEGVRLINYERYESAKKALQPLAANNAEANYYLGIAELGLENVSAARAVFSSNPEEYHNQAGMARVLFLEGKKTEAAELLNKIVDKAKKKEWEKYKVAADAITYTNGGNIQDAISWYQKALERNQNADIYIGLGDAYLKLQTGGGEAMNNYQKAVEAGTNNSLAYSRIGSLWYDAHNYDAALKSYNQAKEADAKNPLPYRDLAQAYQRAGRYENSLKNIEEYLAKSDQTENDQIQYANALYLAEKYPAALSKMEELLNKGVEKPYMYRIIAYTSYETDDIDKALSNMHTFFNKEKDKKKILIDDYMYYGKIMLAMAERDSALAPAYVDSAVQNFNKVVTMDSSEDKSELYRNIAEGFKDAKEYALAGDWYGKIIADNADAAPLDYFYWGYWSFYGEKYDKAADAFNKMLEKYPDEGSAYYWRARVAAAKDSEAQTGEAVPYFTEWIDFQNEAGDYEHQDNDLILAYQYMAYYYYNQNNKAEAIKWANKILEKKPDDEWAASIKNYFESKKD